MPLDGHAYLVNQGWEGKGSGLRKGAIAKPIAVVQKKSLSGVGKDRDEAFPFWDHVFSAAASAIKIKTTDSDSDNDECDTSTANITLQRTATGIISNRRPTLGTPALSSSSSSSSSGANTPRMSIMAAAKQEAARRMLYSMFFRGPVMRSDDPTPMPTPWREERTSTAGVDLVVEAVTEKLDEVKKKEKKSRKGKEKEVVVEEDAGCKKRKKGKEERSESKAERKERKRRKLEVGEEDQTASGSTGGTAEPASSESGGDKSLEKAERKRRREEKRARKEEKRRRKEAKLANASEVVAADPSAPQDEVLPVVNNVEMAGRKDDPASEDPSDSKPRKKRKKDATF